MRYFVGVIFLKIRELSLNIAVDIFALRFTMRLMTDNHTIKNISIREFLAILDRITKKFVNSWQYPSR